MCLWFFPLLCFVYHCGETATGRPIYFASLSFLRRFPCIIARPLIGVWYFMYAVLLRRSFRVCLAILVADRFVAGLFVVFYRFLCLLFPLSTGGYAGQCRGFRRCVVRSVVSLSVGVNNFQGRSWLLRFKAWDVRPAGAIEGANLRFQ